MKHAILGTGAIGSVLAVALTEAHAEPLMIGREAQSQPQSITLLRDSGERTISVRVTDRITRGDEIDVLWIATKAPGLAKAVERIDCKPALVIPLLNGLEHVEWLRTRFGTAVRAASVIVEALRVGTSIVSQRSAGIRLRIAGLSDTEKGAPYRYICRNEH
ncbi:MAG: hypothetical protein M3Z14_07475 [Candidatus Eremiobacteraeota bacterium]|nr:hypothetical protein [Candidatus Eremiobacteraeota bacterium]